MNKKLLLGDEAIAQGAVDCGIGGVYAYPGTPSTEITEYIQNHPLSKERNIFCKWCVNEKTAMEGALGLSYIGKRSIVCMKHVGLNVAADPFVNSGIAGVNGGLIVIVADDPSMHSSQDEQDSRFYGKFSFIPVLEPSNQQEAYDMMSYGFDLSERLGCVVLMRVTTRMAHSRSVVNISDSAREISKISYPKDPLSWILLPANSRKKYLKVIERYNTLEKNGMDSPFNTYINGDDKSMAVIACGISYNYLLENIEQNFNHPILKISQYPAPLDKIRQMGEECGSILILEEGQPLLEELLRGVFPTKCIINGRLNGTLPRTGELTPDSVRVALGMEPLESHSPAAELVVPRPPALCMGCGHRDVYTALNEVLRDYKDAKVFSDIGCYTLGAMEPFKAIHSCIDMGASITMAKGAADGGQFPSVAVIGDSTFTHSGITGLLDAANSNSNMLVVISDNLTTGMTGGQDSAGTTKLEAICEAVGVEREHIRVVVPLKANMAEITSVIREELEYKGLSVIIPRRECIQTFKRKSKEKRG